MKFSGLEGISRRLRGRATCSRHLGGQAGYKLRHYRRLGFTLTPLSSPRFALTTPHDSTCRRLLLLHLPATRSALPRGLDSACRQLHLLSPRSALVPTLTRFVPGFPASSPVTPISSTPRLDSTGPRPTTAHLRSPRSALPPSRLISRPGIFTGLDSTCLGL